MSKIYAFLIILPLIAMLFVKTMGFYEFDTKQRYIKNAVDAAAHKVMITGVFTTGDKEELINKLKKLADFRSENLVLEWGVTGPEGVIPPLSPYTPGNILDRGYIFCIKVQSEGESTLSKISGGNTNEAGKLYYRAKALCRIEKRQAVL